jgi:hypothetical protein
MAKIVYRQLIELKVLTEAKSLSEDGRFTVIQKGESSQGLVLFT